MTESVQIATLITASIAPVYDVVDVCCYDWIATMARIITQRLLAQHHESQLPPPRTVATRVRRLSLVISALASQLVASTARGIAWPYQAMTSRYLARGRRAHGHGGTTPPASAAIDGQATGPHTPSWPVDPAA